MEVLKRLISWALRTYPGRLIQAYAGSQAGNYASGVAFTAFISMFPLLLGVVSIIGLATGGSQAAEQHFIDGTSTFFPGDSHDALTRLLTTVHKNSGVLGVVSILGLLWSGSSLFVSMEFALGRMVGARQRDFLRQRAMTLLMTIVYVVAVVANIFLNSAVSLLPSVAPIGPVVGLLVWLAFMATVYRIVPNRTYRLRQMWPGVVLAGTLMEVLSLLWPLYTGLAHGFTTYGQALALFFVLATWLYFLAQFILLGAVANRMHAGAPTARGLVGTREPEPLETDATRAADQFGRASPAPA